jgi:hypothetical protein
MSKVSEIEDWQSKAIGYWNLAAQAGTQATRSTLEDLARATDAVAKEMANQLIKIMNSRPGDDDCQASGDRHISISLQRGRPT